MLIRILESSPMVEIFLTIVSSLVYTLWSSSSCWLLVRCSHSHRCRHYTFADPDTRSCTGTIRVIPNINYRRLVFSFFLWVPTRPSVWHSDVSLSRICSLFSRARYMVLERRTSTIYHRNSLITVNTLRRVCYTWLRFAFFLFQTTYT